MQILPLTLTQDRAVRHALTDLAPGNVVSAHLLEGSLDVDRLRKAVETVYATFGVLRRSLARTESRWMYV